jgi:hypothetical protein
LGGTVCRETTPLSEFGILDCGFQIVGIAKALSILMDRIFLYSFFWDTDLTDLHGLIKPFSF